MADPPIFLPGETLPASKLQALASEPDTYTPQLTAVTTNPTLGTGSSAEGLWVQIGPLVYCVWTIQFGNSGVNAGSGVYRVSLPVDVAPGALAEVSLGSGRANDASVGTDLGSSVFHAQMAPGLPDRIQMYVEEAVAISNSTGWTWAASDRLSGFCLYPGDF